MIENLHTDMMVAVDGVTSGPDGEHRRVQYQLARGVRELTLQSHGLYSVIEDHDHCYCDRPGQRFTVGTGVMVWTAEETMASLIRLRECDLPGETRERLLKEQEGWSDHV